MSGELNERECSGNERSVFAHIREQHEQQPSLVAWAGHGLTSEQAFEAAFRFIASYYSYERIVPILHLLDAMSWPDDHPGSNNDAWAVWQVCVQRTLDGARRPQPPPPWA